MPADPAVPDPVRKTLVRGDTREWTEVFEQNTGTATAPVWVPLDISGYTFIGQIRSDLDRGALLCTFTFDTSNAVAGVLGVTLPHGEADALPGQEDPEEFPVVYGDIQGTRTSDDFRKTFKRYIFTVDGDSSNV